jgi:tetratricopeptide (TPR) repeat protein
MNSNKFLKLALEYLQNEPKRHFGDLDRLISSVARDSLLRKQIREIIDRDTHFFLEGRLFSRIITTSMAQFNEDLQEDYYFQQNFLTVFKKFYLKAREKGSDQIEAEQRAAKIIWNFIETKRYEQAVRVLIKDYSRVQDHERNLELMKRYRISENLVKIVQAGISSQKSSTSVYNQISDQIDKALESYLAADYKGMSLLFETALNNIKKYEREKISAKFALLVGALLSSKEVTISKGIYFLKRARLQCQELGDNFLLAECLAEMSNAYWTQGLYKNTLDILSTEINLHEKQNNTLGVMFSEEKLSHFFRNLCRYNESQSWAHRHLNSAIGAADHLMKGFYFLDANLNYAKTLIGLNSWEKAEKHISFSEKTLNHLEISPQYLNKIMLEIHCMRGNIAVIRGKFDEAKFHFDKRNEYQPELMPQSPMFGRFLRAEATLYRNQQNFSNAIHTLQPLFQNKDELNPLNVALLAELLALHDHENEAFKLLKRAKKVLKSWNSIHGLSRIYLSLGYVNFLMGDFTRATKFNNEALEVVPSKTELNDLKVSLEAHTTLAYIAMEKGNFKLAETHCNLAEESAIMSGSKAFILDSYLIKAILMTLTGKEIAGINAIRRISTEALDSEIAYIYRKSKIQLKKFYINLSKRNR